MAQLHASTVTVPKTETGGLRWTKKKSQLRIAWGRFYRDKMALLGGTMIVVVALMAVFAPYLSPHDPYGMDITKRLRPPGTPGRCARGAGSCCAAATTEPAISSSPSCVSSRAPSIPTPARCATG